MNKMHYRQQGISLIELMIAITLSLILGVALVQVFVSSKSAYRMQEATARLQESGRYAIDALSHDIRMAGLMGCASVGNLQIANKIGDFDTVVIDGLNNVTAGNTYGAVPGTDVLIVGRASDSGARLAGAVSETDTSIQIVSNAPEFKKDQRVFIASCVYAEQFDVADDVQNETVPLSESLGRPYGEEAEVFAYQTSAYFVRDTGRTTSANRPIRALYVRQPHDTGTAYELVEGVENIQLEFGMDTNNDGAADEYRPNVSGALWNDVVSVRMNFLLQSVEEGLVGSGGAMVQQLRFNDVDVAADGRLRQVFSMVVAIRNRLP